MPGVIMWLERLKVSVRGASDKSEGCVACLLCSSGLQVLFVSPERLLSETFLSVMAELPPVQLAVVDEAHCVSEW